MTIHYRNKAGKTRFISGVIHLNHVSDNLWIASMPNGTELKLLTFRIQGIYHEDRPEEQK